MSVRIIIVDDSKFFQRRLSEIFASDPSITVVGIANDGQEAIELVNQLKPDVITMDMEMPVMDGITAVRKIMAQNPTPILMLSTWTTEGAKSTLQALEAGAVDYMPKRFEDMSNNMLQVQQKLCRRIKYLARNISKEHVEKPPINQTVKQTKVSNTSNTKNIRIVAIGTSTGGPVALQKVLTQLPVHFPHPIILVQHMPAAFTPSFAERLDSQCNIHVKQAEDGEKLKAGTAYLAPGGMQMIIEGKAEQPYITIQQGKEAQNYKPCIDISFESVAKIYPKNTLAIILTGMGSDGKNACQTLHNLGSTIWAQDEKSSTIYGMPMVIAQAGLANDIFDINDLGHHLAELT